MAVTQAISPLAFAPNSNPLTRARPSHPRPIEELSPSLLFPAAAAAYIRARSINTAAARYVSKNTIKNYTRQTRALSLFFESKALNKITLRDLRDYQEARVQGAAPFIRRRRPHEEPAPCPCLPQQVNQELCFLRAMMRRAGCKMVALQHYEELQKKSFEGNRALSPEEQRLWLDASGQRERWHLVPLVLGRRVRHDGFHQ